MNENASFDVMRSEPGPIWYSEATFLFVVLPTSFRSQNVMVAGLCLQQAVAVRGIN
jgi:hypothetical protein